MSAALLDGKELAEKLKSSLKTQLNGLEQEYKQTPRLVNVMLGSAHSACAYAKSQKKVAEEIGLRYELKTLPETTTQKALIECVQALNADKNVNGIMVHKPVPHYIDYRSVANHVDPAKDLEGINVANIGKMILGETKIIPCTPAAVMEHIKYTAVPLRGKEAVIVGHSEIVGKPLSLLLLREMATVTVCHVATSEAGKLEEHVRRADVLVVAVGKPFLVKGDWIKKGAVVVDVGINKFEGRTVGDVEFETARVHAGFITPVPGGVGPVTVVMLMRNGIEAFKLQKQSGAKK